MTAVVPLPAHRSFLARTEEVTWYGYGTGDEKVNLNRDHCNDSDILRGVFETKNRTGSGLRRQSRVSPNVNVKKIKIKIKNCKVGTVAKD